MLTTKEIAATLPVDQALYAVLTALVNRLEAAYEERETMAGQALMPEAKQALARFAAKRDAASGDSAEAVLKSLVSLCPSEEGLGGHAPIGAFINLGHRARKVLATTAASEG